MEHSFAKAVLVKCLWCSNCNNRFPFGIWCSLQSNNEKLLENPYLQMRGLLHLSNEWPTTWSFALLYEIAIWRILVLTACDNHGAQLQEKYANLQAQGGYHHEMVLSVHLYGCLTKKNNTPRNMDAKLLYWAGSGCCFRSFSYVISWSSSEITTMEVCFHWFYWHSFHGWEISWWYLKPSCPSVSLVSVICPELASTWNPKDILRPYCWCVRLVY